MTKSFWGYVSQGLATAWTARYAQETGWRNRLRRIARYLPLARYLWDRVWSIRRSERRWALHALLKSSNPNYAEFMQIYRSITEDSGVSAEVLRERGPAKCVMSRITAL